MGYPNLDLVGIEDYMGRITEFANSVKPGSLRVNASMGDERNAILMVTLQTDGQYGAITFHMARLYLLNDNDKIKEEKVIYYTVKD
jgi:hypothetical protein